MKGAVVRHKREFEFLLLIFLYYRIVVASDIPFKEGEYLLVFGFGKHGTLLCADSLRIHGGLFSTVSVVGENTGRRVADITAMPGRIWHPKIGDHLRLPGIVLFK